MSRDVSRVKGMGTEEEIGTSQSQQGHSQLGVGAGEGADGGRWLEWWGGEEGTGLQAGV